MGYRVKRIKALEEENGKLKKNMDFWRNEAIRLAAELGERKISEAMAGKKDENIGQM